MNVHTEVALIDELEKIARAQAARGVGGAIKSIFSRAPKPGAVPKPTTAPAAAAPAAAPAAAAPSKAQLQAVSDRARRMQGPEYQAALANQAKVQAAKTTPRQWVQQTPQQAAAQQGGAYRAQEAVQQQAANAAYAQQQAQRAAQFKQQGAAQALAQRQGRARALYSPNTEKYYQMQAQRAAAPPAPKRPTTPAEAGASIPAEGPWKVPELPGYQRIRANIPTGAHPGGRSGMLREHFQRNPEVFYQRARQRVVHPGPQWLGSRGVRGMS